MYQGGGAPPYGPGGPAGSPGYPQQPRKSSAGMWIVIGGGAVIVILVIAVVAVVIRNSGGEPQAAQGSGGEEQQGGESGGSEESQQGGEGGEGEEDSEGGGQAQGEPPYELPEEPCDALSEEASESYSLDSPNKSLTDNRSSCSWSVDGEGETYGTLRVEYSVPFAGADSVEGAKTDYEDAVDYATDEDDSYTERTVDEEQEVDLGDEATLVFGTEKTISNESVGTMLIRSENMNIEVRYSMMPGLGADEDAPAPLEFSDVEDMMHDLGEQSLNHVGS
ncbi:DUF3558 domain-containing protein [Halostreptopolyspora alba]|uniref:DUF3558 domain-containing protein n=1 Tax=Halostreptopolyspora alba TaxID=2487137 RepID=A0A3N0E769_9ACTN|nr:DUF3558 domain-containing protein [Nocardiopsaceae bacterium YIM 96095]